MPFSFIEIEEGKKRVVFFIFAFLVLFYFVGFWILSVTARILFEIFGVNLHATAVFQGNQISFKHFFLLTPTALSIIFFMALASGFLHWHFSTSKMRENILTLLKAQPPDKDDKYHRRLQNIVDEVSVATGGRNFECVVLPTMAMNAFSLDDLKGQPVIGVTEGILSRLNRAELEAVIAHEAAHIVSRDSFIKSISVSIFGVYGFILDKLKTAIEQSAASDDNQRGIHPSIIIIFIVTAMLHGFGKFISMFISRQCEYRADAVVVRLTREPLSLARALYYISKRWRGGGIGYERLESLFMINPSYNELDEREDFLADLFSTHPPVGKRIDILLNMAHSDPGLLKEEKERIRKKVPREIQIVKVEEPKWFIVHENKWQGPFSAGELIGAEIIRHESFVRKENENKINLAYQDKELLKYLTTKPNEFRGAYQCPRCYKILGKALYEGASVYICESCRGVLLEGDKIPRILSREEQGFTEEIIREAEKVENTSKKLLIMPRVKMDNELPCPECKRLMNRSFYSLAFPVEIDRCSSCNYVWFDKNELEVLQYLIEKEEI